MDWKKLVISIVTCGLVAAVGMLFILPALSSWYPMLDKPEFMPPNWVFGPVWAALYLMMAAAFYLAWTKKDETPESKEATGIFTVQLIFNAFWPALFFGLHNPLLAFIEILMLIIIIIWNMIEFWKLSKGAALLLVPYLLWTCFAAVLNFYIMILNQIIL